MSSYFVKKEGFPRIFVIGIDGATFEIISSLVNEGKMPNLAKIIHNGSYGELESTIPPVTIPAWWSMVTGKNPGKLGFFDLLKRNPDNYGVTPVKIRSQDILPVWNILNRYGFRTGLINIPGTYPPSKIDGFMVAGMFTPSDRYCYSYPLWLKKELDETVSRYEIDVGQWQYFDDGNFIRALCRVAEKRGRAVLHLIESLPCEFYMVVFTCTDRLQHVLWEKRFVIEEYWSWFDRILGAIFERFEGNTNFLLVSDHGFGRINRTFYVNEWLRRKGYLAIKQNSKGGVFIEIGRRLERLYWKLGRFKIVNPIARILNKLIGLDRLQYITYNYLSKDRLINRTDWSRTKAFALVHSPHYGHIYINLRGRMPQGCVAPEDYERVREEILNELSKLHESSREDAVDVKVYRREEIYEGPYVDEAPDIIFSIDNFECEVDPRLDYPKIFEGKSSNPRWTGTHTRKGIFIAHGPDIREGFQIKGAEIVDVAPTILHLLGTLIPKDIDGKILMDIFKEGSEVAKRIPIYGFYNKDLSTGPILDDGSQSLIMERLRKLGYI